GRGRLNGGLIDRCGLGCGRFLEVFLARGAGLGLLGLARVFLGLEPQRLFALALLALLGFDFGPAALALFLALAFVLGAAHGLLGLAGRGGLRRLQPAFHLGIGEAGRPARGIPERRRRARSRRRPARLRHNDPLALRRDDDILRPAVAEALLHLTGTPAAEAKGFLAVCIAHAVSVSFPASVPPIAARKPDSFAASSTTRW